MKKVFLFLSILMFVFTGVFYACSKDRYADLKISINSVASTSAGKTIEKVDTNKDGKVDYYQVLYNDEFTIDASVSCSSDISTSLVFTSINDESVHKITSTNTQNGSKAIFKAVAPSYGELFKIKVESVETSRRCEYIYLKVVLPVEQILLTDNLGFTYGNSLDLANKDCLTYVSTDPSAPYETNEKGISFTLNSYTDLEGNTFNLYVKENDASNCYYYKNSDEVEIAAFKLENNVLSVLEKQIEGSINVSAKSEKYNDALDEISIENANQNQLDEIFENNKLKDKTDISIVKPILYEDISFVGGQVVFADYNSDGNKDSKLSTSLYLNSDKTYKIGEKTHYYNYENIEFTVYTKESVKITAEIGGYTTKDEKGNDVTVNSDNNVVRVSIPETLTVFTDSETGKVTGYKTDIKLIANGGSGFAYVDLIVQYTTFANTIKYKFSDLYKDYIDALSDSYLSSLDSNELEKIQEYAEIRKLIVESTAIPAQISLMQDDKSFDINETIKVYDTYGNSDGHSSYGTKISANLTLSSGTVSSKIKDENKLVKVYISDSAYSGLEVSKYFELYDSQYNRITLTKEIIENSSVTTTNYYFMLDLTKNSKNSFYVKASSTNLANGLNFIFKFENILASVITTYANEVIQPNDSEKTTLTNLTTQLTAKTVKGVEDVVVKTKIVNADLTEDFYTLNGESSTNPLYTKLVLQVNEGENVTSSQGTLIGFLTNLYVVDDIKVSVDSSYLKVFTLNKTDYSDYFKTIIDSDTTHEFKGVLSIVGKKIGNTTIVLSAENGYKTEVEVKIVKAFASVEIDLEQSYGKDIIAQNYINRTGNEYASAKVNGSFNIVHKVAPNDSAVYSVKYASSADGIVEINQSTGMVKTISKGSTTITIEFFYYNFESVNGFYQWGGNVVTKTFVLEVFVPATTIKLDKRIVNVYDYNTLGYEYKDLSTVAINVLVYPQDANIANDETYVKFYLSNNNNNLIGKNGTYTAFLNENEERAVVQVVVYVEEFGKTAILYCTVNIYKAPQVENINISVFEGSTQRNVKNSGNDSDGHKVLYLSTQNNKSLTINTSILPSSNEVLVDDLVVQIYKSDENKNLLALDTSADFASLYYAKQTDSSIITNGQDSFVLNIGQNRAGYFYVLIFARDSMSSSSKGEVYVKLLVEITDGTQANPYVIEDLNQLIEVNSSPTKHYVLGNNISLASISNWSPIKGFTGTLNGYNTNIENGTYFKISGLKINTINSANVGLFETISNSTQFYGAVMNLTLEVSNINLYNYTVPNSVIDETINIGAIAGTNNGVIANCAVKINSFRVSLTNKNANIGGVVGYNMSSTALGGGLILNFSDNDNNHSSDFNLEINAPSGIMAKKVAIPVFAKTYMVSTNPVSGNIIVSDKEHTFDPESGTGEQGYHVSVGGMVGYNDNGYINGIYGIYNQRDEQAKLKADNAQAGDENVNYITNYQSQGIDVSININNGSVDNIGNIVNLNSSIGGVVGLSAGGYISNVSAEGNIGMYNFDTEVLKGAFDNVGGIIGKTIASEKENANSNTITEVSSSVKLRGRNSVGGVVGFATDTDISKARVESYESINSNDQTLIIAATNVGGVVGLAINNCSLTLVYSYSFVDKFNDDYIVYGDIYSTADTAYLGGLVGYSTEIDIDLSYSTFNLIATGRNSLVAGLIGAVSAVDDGENSFVEKVNLTNVFYVGVIVNEDANRENSEARIHFAYNNTNNYLHEPVIGDYYYYYLLEYAKSSILNEPVIDGEEPVVGISEYDCFIVASRQIPNNDYFDANKFSNSVDEKVYEMDLYLYNETDSVYELDTISFSVPVYKVDNDRYLFIRTIPNQIDVKAKGEAVSKNNDTLMLDFLDENGKKVYYYTYTDASGVEYLILNYSKLTNTFKLSQLFEIIPTPIVYGNLDILVFSSDNKNLVISNEGDLTVNGVGEYVFTFVVKENVKATQTIKIIVLKSFDELLLSNIPTFKESLFTDPESGEEKVHDVRVKNEFNIFNVFAEYVKDVDTSSSSIIYNTKTDEKLGKLNLVEISNINEYAVKFNYKVEFKAEGGSTYTDITETNQYELPSGEIIKLYEDLNGGIKFNVVGNYRVTLSVVFEFNHVDYEIVSSNQWYLDFNVFAGATKIEFNTNEIWLQGQEIYDSLQLSLTSDIGKFEDLYLVIQDPNRNYEYEYKYTSVVAEGQERLVVTTFDMSSGERNQINVEYPFTIIVKEVSTQNDVYHYNLTISINENFKAVSQPEEYLLKAYDGNEKLLNKPAQTSLVIVPQSLKGISGIHYAYTQKVSELENIANTDPNPDLEEDVEAVEKNYSYSFTNQPKNTVVAGNEGLFVIDLYPFYANITSVSIESNLGAESGNALQFVQLVKIAQAGDSSSDYCYIYAPLTQSTENNGIYLNLYSYVPSDVANITYTNQNQSTINLLNDNKTLKYNFVEENEKTGSETARLYVKTIAPTNLKEEEQFVVSVKVKYNVVNESGELEEREYVYNHNLVVESLPGFSMRIVHEGVDRNIIAYTGSEESSTSGTPDWLEIIPNAEEGYTSIDITVTHSKGGGNTEYVMYDKRSNIITLGPKAGVGDTIKVLAMVTLDYEGYTETRPYTATITVVDVVIESITVKDLDANDDFKITVSTSRQLKAIIKGFGTKTAIEEAESKISRYVTYEDNLNYYWQAKSNKSGEQYVNLESSSIRNNLPFVVNKLTISNDMKSVTVNNNSLGAGNGVAEQTFNSLEKVLVLEGSTDAGTVAMRLAISYVYHNVKDSKDNGSIIFVPNTFTTSYTVEKYFNVVVTEDSNEDNPTPVYNEEDLINMSKASIGSYILMNDITINNHTALEANFSSFDGNNKIITINNFLYSTDIIGTNGNHELNLGLFNTVSNKTIIKNVIVAYPADKTEAMNLKGYSSVKFGGIAAVNSGVITNCDVITVTNKPNINLSNYENPNYMLNIETETSAPGEDGNVSINVSIGGLVAVNETNGFITNSRVGRDKVDILKVYDSEASVVYKEQYRYTAPMTIMKVYGKAVVGGFVAKNNGTIATSYAKNLQLEVISISPTSYVKAGGFVVDNTGFIHGSYSAGWEEETTIDNNSQAPKSDNRKLGGGILSNGFIGGFVFNNEGYIEDCYSNINLSGNLLSAARTTYVDYLMKSNASSEWPSPAVGGFVYKSTSGSNIITSYSLSKIYTGRLNTHGSFEGRNNSPDPNFTNEGSVENCYFMVERTENVNYEHEKAKMLSDEPVIDLEGSESVAGVNEFINPSSFNNFSFDISIDNFNGFEGTSSGGVWAKYLVSTGKHGYPDLISANTIAISCRVINVTKTNNSETNTYYYTYVDGYDIGSYTNPYIISNFEQYNNIFKDVIGEQSYNENITTKFTGNIRLIKNIDFMSSQEVYSTSIEYTSLVDKTSIFDGNYLAMYNIKLSDRAEGKSAFGLFKDIYYSAVKNLTLVVDSVNAGNTTAVGTLAGAIVNSNISNITLAASSDETGVVTGNNYVGALAGIIISSSETDLYTIANIKSNLAIVGSNPETELISAVTSSFQIWEQVKPTSSSSGLSEVNNNLRLHKLPKKYNYAGGIAGFVDLNQKIENPNSIELTTPNVYNIHVGKFIANTILGDSDVSYNRVVSVISNYAGGLFGFIGSQTYVECAEFIAGQENKEHFISANEIAGGIVAVNFGKISQSYLSFDKETVLDLNNNILDYVNKDTTAKITLNSSFFAENTPKYIGGIAGINVGNGSSLGAGNIVDCYNRLDVKNVHAKGVGGIVGATYIGQISNVYTTASLMGDLTDKNTKLGGIIGKIFENADEGYFADYYGSGKDYSMISLFNIVALNLWDPNDFDALYEFVNTVGGKIGALYGEYKNDTNTDDALIKLTGYIFVQNYALKDYTDSYIAEIEYDKSFDMNELDPYSYFELWGVQPASSVINYDEYLFSQLCQGENNESLIYPNDYRALFSGSELEVSPLRNIYFPSTKWSRIIWNYDDENLLPILEYGYESSVIRIYTANQFLDKLREGNSAGKMYVIMNDIDFDGVNITPITTTFRGQLYGNNVTYTYNGNTYTRKPILFNVDLVPETMGTSLFAILQNSIGATYSNFNIVLRNYDVQFSADIDQETIASVLIGNATNSNIDNVNIYSSLLDNVNRETMTNQTFDNRVDGIDFNVTQGYLLDDTTKYITQFSVGYLKLATLDSDTTSGVDDSATFQYQYIFRYEETVASGVTTRSYKMLNEKFDLFEGKFVDLSLDEAGKVIEITSPCVVKTNASTVGLIIGAGSLSYITNSSVNIDMQITYDIANTAVKYVGSATGRIIGEIRDVVSTSSITIVCDYVPTADEPSDIDELYIGGIVGNLQGVVRSAYVKNNFIKLGTDVRPVVARSGAAGTFLGGVIGAIDRYTTVNEAVVGGADYLYVLDCDIKTYVKGNSSVAGVIGKNSYTVNDIYVKQSPNGLGEGKQKSITIYVNDENSSPIVSGVIANNRSTYMTNVYSNTSVYAVLGDYDTVNIGGIMGMSESDSDFRNIVCDAEEIKITRETNKLGTVYIGGILGQTSGVGLTASLRNVFSTVNIISEQEESMFIGGAIGTCSNLVLSNVEILGNITLNRGKGDGTKVKSNTISAEYQDTYYYLEDHYIGGLVGNCSSSYVQEGTSIGTFVLSTIRDYAIAQKLNGYVGPVFGNSLKDSVKTKIYFCEAIALVSDNGYNKVFTNVVQTALLDEEENIYRNIYDGICKSLNFAIENSENVYSNYYSNYYEVVDGMGSFYKGCKLRPINYNQDETEGGKLSDGKYYILSEETKNRLNSDGKNWVLNAQGNRVSVSGAAIDTVTEGSALVGVIVVKEGDYANEELMDTGIIAKNNYGFMFGCGSAGSVRGSGVAGVVCFNYGVVNSCFSIANIKVSAGAGLVSNNGNSTNEPNCIGNIYSSFYTGTLYPSQADANLAGIASATNYGIISNSYTMGDINITETSSGVLAHPIADSNNNYNIYNTYYDYLCYAADNGQDVNGISQEDAKKMKVAKYNAATGETKEVVNKEFGYISKKGVYVWSSTLAGDTNGLNYVALGSILKGSWLVPGDESELNAMFAKTPKMEGKNIDDIKLDTSWFNYGYTTVNLTNIVVNSSTRDNITEYLLMLYTGNGKAHISNVSADNPVMSYETFIDQAYQIKHAGMLDILVRGNCSDTITFKYYILVNNIDFKKYSGSTYWSQSWDQNNTIFVGDFYGNDKKIINMYSSYGLLRALPSISNMPSGKVTKVYDLTFDNCYSKTGLIAGYQETGIIDNVEANASYVINGNYEEFLKAKNANGTFSDDVSLEKATIRYKFLDAQGIQDIPFNSAVLKNISYTQNTSMHPDIYVSGNVEVGSAINTTGDNRNIFAGGLVGIFANGEIKNTNEFDNLTVVVRDTNSASDTYIGGLVGIMSGGKIGDSEDGWNLSGINIYASIAKASNVNKNYIGGVAGLINSSSGNALVQNVTVTNGINLKGYYSIGGVAGAISAGTIKDCSNQATINVINNFIEGNTFDNDESVKTTKVLVGGMVGYMSKGQIEGCLFTEYTVVTVKLDMSAAGTKYITMGGIAGQMDTENAVVKDCTISNTVSIVAEDKSETAEIYAGGIVGFMNNGKIDDSATLLNKEIKATTEYDSAGYAISGGIAGLVINGKIGTDSGEVINNAKVLANNSAGGIVGEIRVNTGNNVEVKAKNANGEIYAISNATKKAKSEGQKAGGIVGYIINKSKESTTLVKIRDCSVSSSTKVGDGGSNFKYAIFSGGIVGAIINTDNNASNEGVVITNATSEAKVNAYSTGKTGTLGEDDAITDVSFTGGIVGYVKFATIQDVVNKGTVGDTAKASYAGGIVGYLENGKIVGKDSDSTAINTGNVSAELVAGGVVGASINGYFTKNLVNSGIVTTTKTGSVAAGIFGYTEKNTNVDDISIYKNTGNVGSDSTTVAGGIVGIFNGILYKEASHITKAYNAADIIATNTSKIKTIQNLTIKTVKGEVILQSTKKIYEPTEGVDLNTAGGIVGYVGEQILIRDVETTNSAKIVKATLSAGGILGVSEAQTVITDVVNDSKVEATNGNAGGVMGHADYNSISINPAEGSTGNIENTGAITAKGGNAGGIIGLISSIGKVSEEGCSYNIINSGVITSDKNAGGIIGRITTNKTIYKTENKGNVTGTNFAGGIVGYLDGGAVLEASNAVTGGTIKGSENEGSAAGGVIGIMKSGTSYVNVTTATFGKTYYVGGLAGYVDGDCDLFGTVSVNVNNGKQATGGVVGYLDKATLEIDKDSEGNVEHTISASGKTVTSDNFAGGLVGIMAGGEIAGGTGGNAAVSNSGAAAGGLVGKMTKGEISSGTGGTATASTSGDSSAAGGIVGLMSEGDVAGGTGGSATGYNAGGIVGLMTNGEVSKGTGGSATGGTNAGGIVGKMSGGEVSGGFGGSAKSGSNNGGIVGYLSGGEVSGGSGGSAAGGDAGGIAGEMVGGSITGGSGGNVTSGTNSGGVVGYLNGANIDGGSGRSVSGTNAGGVAGYVSSGRINNGGASSVTGSSSAGGVVGKSGGTGCIINVNASCGASGAGSSSGGILGYGAAVINSNSVSGAVASGGGGIVGNNGGGSIYLAADTIEVSCTGISGIITASNPSDGSIGSNTGVTVKANGQACSFVPTNSGLLKNITTAGEISLTIATAGILTNTNTGEIVDCVNGISMEISTTSFGGIAGSNSGTISDCTNKGDLSGTSPTKLGGIAGTNSGTIYNCVNEGDITTSASSPCVGGIAGTNSGKIGGSSSKNEGNISGVGASGGTIQSGQSAFTSFTEPEAKVGGIVGSNTGTAVGDNSGDIRNIAQYVSTDTNASIKDYRGQVAGFNEGGGTVKKLTTHTEFKITGKAPEKESIGDSQYLAIAFVVSGDDIIDWHKVPSGPQSMSAKYKVYDEDPGRSGGPLRYNDVENYGTHKLYEQVKGFTTHKSLYVEIHAAEILNSLDKDSSSGWGLQHKYWGNNLTGDMSDNSLLGVRNVSQQVDYDLIYWIDKRIRPAEYSADEYDFEKGVRIYAFYDDDDDNHAVVIAVIEIQKFHITEDTQDEPNKVDLQDCGGEVTEIVAEGEYQKENGHQLYALKKLYDLCGPCGSKSDIVAPSLSKSLDGSDPGGSPGSGSGGGGGGTGSAGADSGLPPTIVDSGSLSNFECVEWFETAWGGGYDDPQRWGYCWAGYGDIMNESYRDAKLARAREIGAGQSTLDMINRSYNNWNGRRVADCSGMFLGFMRLHLGTGIWGKYGYTVGAQYRASTYYGERGSIGNIPSSTGIVLDAWGFPNVPGVRITFGDEAHTGLYIGNGIVIHASGTDAGVKRNEVGSKAWGSWYKWSLPPGIDIKNSSGTVVIQSEDNPVYG